MPEIVVVLIVNDYTTVFYSHVYYVQGCFVNEETKFNSSKPY